MKKKITGFSWVEVLLVVLIVGLMCCMPGIGVTPAQAVEPASKELALPGTAPNEVIWTYSNGLARDAFGAFKIKTRIGNYEVAATSDVPIGIYRGRNGKTNLVSSFTIASGGTALVSAESNEVWFFRGDTVKLSTPVLGTGTVELVVEEQ